MVELRKRGLGNGLASLLGDDYFRADAPDTAAQPMDQADPGGPPAANRNAIPIEFIEANPDQPRRHFDETELNNLADSIRERGIIQPIIVRPCPNAHGRYQIVAGERRWRAAQKAQLHEVPVIVRELTDSEVLELAILENVQRSDLNPLEEAEGYANLIEQFGYTQEQLAQIMGKSRSHIANMMRLMNLPEPVKAMLVDGKLSAGHARALLTARDIEGIAKQVTSGGLNVRQTEALVKKEAAPAPTGIDPLAPPPASGNVAPLFKDPDTRALEGDISAALGAKVAINHKGANGGEIRVSYKTLDQLDDICKRLCHQPPAPADY